MAHPLSVSVRNTKIRGGRLVNVGHPMERENFTLESRVAFDALLNAGAQYSAPRCHADTRERAQNEVKGWLRREGEGSEKGIMWMSGAAGVGKSAIVHTVCEELVGDNESDPLLSDVGSLSYRHVDGCFFFKQGIEARDDVSFFPPTIAYQLARSRASYRKSIDKTTADDPSVFNALFPSQFRQLLLFPAKHLDPLEDPITIVIDGLDECPSAPDQVELLKLILEAVKTTRMRFLITSRPEQHIHAFFHQWDVSQHTYHVHLDEETFNTSQDIKVFLREEFARIRRERPEACPSKLSNGEDWPGERVLDHLTVESDSQFMFPTLAIGWIDTPFSPLDKQLRVLLETPPSRAFSALDTLYNKILSHRPLSKQPQFDGEDDLREYQEVLMAILRVIIIAWSGKPLSAAEIAAALDRPVEVVQNVVCGPMRTLFKFRTSDLNSPITLCHRSLRDYLLDRKRSGEFFISTVEKGEPVVAIQKRARPPIPPSKMELDTHYHHVISRSCAPEPLPGSDDLLALRKLVMGILQVVICWPEPLSVSGIARVLDMEVDEVQAIIHGPMAPLLEFDSDDPSSTITLYHTSLRDYLLDRLRSQKFHFPAVESPDKLYIKILSRQPRRDGLMGVLTVTVAWPVPLNVPQIVSVLGVVPSLVENVISGPARALFTLDGSAHNVHLFGPMQDFLLDAGRAGEYLISNARLDTIFIQILSRQPPSDASRSYSPDVLMGVLSVVLALGGRVKVPQIASLLVHPDYLSSTVQH